MLDPDTPRPSPTFPIVGVGASSGGLDGFTQLLRCLPPDTGLAFVLIQHLDRTHPSLLSEVLAKATTMPVREAEHGMPVERSHVYVMPPNVDMAIRDGRLVLSPRTEGPKTHLPVDFFLRSLAAEFGPHAIGVILSGSASDGTDGLRAIRAEAGITFVQDPRSAKFASMPQSAIDAGVADFCLDIPQLADELVRLSRHPYVNADQSAPEAADAVRDEILSRVRNAIGVDFSEFKASTVTRRLARRMALRRVVGLPAYLALLDAEPDEVRALYEDMLIHVTSFFRDPEMFEALRTVVFPEILQHKSAGGGVRVWVAGCSTGEEVYSIAIALLELSSEQVPGHSIQVFGSDLSEVAIQKARAGTYSDGAMHGVSDERRTRFFTKVDSGYRINKRVREHCVFVRHDLVRDPPFSKLDIVSCRNVLIYFEQSLQKKILPTLHYCLNQPGFLVLGRSENISGLSQLFSVTDTDNKIFARTGAASSLRFAPRPEVELSPAGRPSERGPVPLVGHGATFAKHLDRLLLARYCPPGVLVDDNMQVLLFRGHTGSYLQAAPGQPQNNLISMARGGLIAALRTTIAQAKQEQAVVTCHGVEVDLDGSIKTCDVVVVPFSGLPDSQRSRFIVLFEEPGARPAHAIETQRALPRTDAATETDGATERRRNAQLEHELAATKEYLHTLVEEHGRANDELGTSNEELISGNEELQSMNEELETAKEELQSINEELTTLNDELRASNQEVTQANTDLLNFALTVDVSILTLDMDRRIRRFTPRARSLLNVLPSDVGRAIDDIKLNIDAPDLDQQISEVIASGVLRETEVKDKDGRWFRMQIRPYARADSTIDGAIVSLVDIHHLKQLVAEAEHARSEAERANCAKDDFLATLSHELRTPLSSMLLNAQRLRSGEVVEPADLQRAGASLERATWLQVKLIDDLLDVSRIVADKLTLESRVVDLGKEVQAALDGVGSLIEAKSLVSRLSLDPALEPIWADRARVQQVVSNLLTNAIKFTPRGGHVTVLVDVSGGFARVRVTDTGIGIETDFLPHVFTRFSQRDRSITRKYGGLGLGLALVRHLVEVQGGTVNVESPGPGHGASFAVTFPLARMTGIIDGAPAPAPHTDALDRPGKVQRYGGLVDLRVLFVDDDLRTREAVLEVLELSGARVEIASSAAEGASAVERFDPHVILCDIAMPGEDGYSFIRKLRAREAGGTVIPALALTALASSDDRRRAIAAGFQLHLAKPIDIDRLRDAVLELSRLAAPSSLPASRGPDVPA